MRESPISSPHWHNRTSVSAMMREVILALVPAILCSAWLFGWGIIIHCLLAIVFALSLEFIVLKIRQRDPQPFLKDGSVIVTAVIFALTITPLTSWWVSLLGIAFAVIVVKHLFGGIGYNIFNPAMAAYVFVLLSFPVEMNAWPLPASLSAHTLTEAVEIIFAGDARLIDSYSGATALSELKTGLISMSMVSEIVSSTAFGQFAGRGTEWVSLCYLAGGLYLLLRGVITWHIPVAVLSGVFISSSLGAVYDSDMYASPVFHLFGGATMLCAFFVATDPVSASTTARGRLVYGALIGVLLYIIRVWGGYPDGAAFAVLLANAFVPLIDMKTRPRVFGERA